MDLRAALMSAGIMVGGSAFAGDPPRAPVEQASQPQRDHSPIAIVSADDVRARGATAQPSTTPVKRRVARVTTCRCGDQPAADSEVQPEQ
jgi:hypothetical protein